MRNNSEQSGQENNPSRKYGRRKFLATAGASVVGLSGFAGNAAAEMDRDNHDMYFYAWCESSSSDDEYVEISWYWENDAWNNGEGPPDVAGIYWDKRKWDLVTADKSTSARVTFNEVHSSDDMKGVSYYHDDYAAVAWDDDNTEYHAQCELSPTGDWTEDERNIFCDFYHTWNDTSIEGIGLQAYGFHVNLSNDDKKWEKGQETDQSEATCGISK